MKKGFEKILVLVDFSPTSVHAAEEAGELAVKFESELYLLHITSPVSLFQSLLPNANYFNKRADVNEISRKNKFLLEKIKIGLKAKYNIQINTIEEKGDLNEVISTFIIKKNIDLVVVAGRKRSNIKEFMFRSIAEHIMYSINCEVLCIYPKSDFSRIKKLVIPVGRFIPKRKIRIAYELVKIFAANVHLISLAKNANGLKAEDLKVLMDTYRYLKDFTNIPVQCSTVIGNNIAEATIRYAKNIKADLILVNPDTESRLKDSFLNGWGRDIINHSPVPVLSVHSVMEKFNKKGLQSF